MRSRAQAKSGLAQFGPLPHHAILVNILLRRVGDGRWDLVLRGTGFAALCGIVLLLFVPESVVLVWLAVFAVPTNTPLSPIFPTAFEPLIMEATRYERALPVGLVALAAYMYTEYLNYHLYAFVLSSERFARLRGRRWVRWGTERFAQAPFATVVIFAFTPLPFWVARCLAILHQYPFRSYMVATAVGRLPRFLAYAWLGAVLQAPSVVLLGVALGGAAAVIAWRLARGERVLDEPVLDAAD
jgi:membrane protein YqaA with SNARE-associated domain